MECRIRIGMGLGEAGVGTFFVMTKLVPARSNKVSQWMAQKLQTRQECIPMARLDVMASPRPIYLQRKKWHQREGPFCSVARQVMADKGGGANSHTSLLTSSLERV